MDELNNQEEDKINDTFSSLEESNADNFTKFVKESLSEDTAQKLDNIKENTENPIHEQSAESHDETNLEIAIHKQSSSSLVNETSGTAISADNFVGKSKESPTHEESDDDFVNKNDDNSVCSESEDSLPDKNLKRYICEESEESMMDKNLKTSICRQSADNLVDENSEIPVCKSSVDSPAVKNVASPLRKQSADSLVENHVFEKSSEQFSVRKLSADISSSNNTDIDEDVELSIEEEKSDQKIEDELNHIQPKLLIQMPDIRYSNCIYDSNSEDGTTSVKLNENNRSDKSVTVNNKINDESLKNPKSESRRITRTDSLSNVDKRSDNVKLKSVTKVNANVLGYVNTDLPNTELSNVDISNLDVDNPTESDTDRCQSEASHSDLLDDLSDFVGFDSENVNKTLQLIQILQKQLARCEQNEFSKDESEDASEDECQTRIESETDDVNNEEISVVNSEGEQIKTSDENNSATSINKATYVYKLTKEINIFEEQVPSGSKRVKKKRKFFGDFEDPEETTLKKQSISKDHVETTKIVNNSSENKENVIEVGKLKEELVSENESSISTPSAEPVVSKVQNKPKRVFFDISNPLFREPFKYGWKREICYRNLPVGSKSKTAYVSYFNPQGKKFKTIRQIGEHLPSGSQLNMKHFTFSKERIFSEEEGSDLEIIRRMKPPPQDLNETGTPNKTLDSDSSNFNKSMSFEEQAKLSSKKKSTSSRSKIVGNTSASENEYRVASTPIPKLKSSKRMRMKLEESEEEMNETPSGSSSKMAMPKILIRGVGTNSKTSSLKFKVSPSKSSSQKKAKKSSKKLSDRSSKRRENAENIDDETGVQSLDESDQDSTSTLKYNSYPLVATSNQNSARSLKRKHSEDAADTSINRAKMAKLDSELCSTMYRSSLTLSNISYLYDPLILCFKYLTVRELLRVSMSCKYLNRIASDPSLWTTVRLKNSKITDWHGFAKALQKRGTKRLDMRKMLCPTAPPDLETMWNNFFEVIPNIKSLEHIDFMRCMSSVVNRVAPNCPNLAVINALQMKGSMPSLESFTKLKHLRELRLRGLQSLNMETNGSKLNFVNNDTLQVLSLTSIKNLNVDTLEAISELQNLHCLELGECESLPNNFSDIIGKLHKLERLRLEKVTNLDPEYSIFDILKNLQYFKYLELVNFEVKVGFDQALARCQNIEELLLIPLYLHQSATANKVIVNGVQKLSKTLKCFVWGLTTELLTVTGIFVDQYQGKRNEGDASSKNGDKANTKKHFDCIPILKALTGEGNSTPEVDILSISSLEKIITNMLPQTRVKVLKMPYSLTWRQSLSECFK